MPPTSPNAIIARFVRELDVNTARFDALADVVERSGGTEDFTPLVLRRALATDYFFRVATEWQIFQDEWTVRAVVHRPTPFKQWLEYQVRSAAQTAELYRRLDDTLPVNVSVAIPARTLTGHQVRAIIDSGGRNVEFPTSEQWKTFAGRRLADPHKRALMTALNDPAQSSFLDLVRELRNYLAHKSSSSLAGVQRATQPRDPEGHGLADSAGVNSCLATARTYKLRDLGTYLDCALGEPDGTRARHIARRLQDFATGLEYHA